MTTTYVLFTAHPPIFLTLRLNQPFDAKTNKKHKKKAEDAKLHVQRKEMDKAKVRSALQHIDDH